jgi:hypothetical protein
VASSKASGRFRGGSVRQTMLAKDNYESSRASRRRRKTQLLLLLSMDGFSNRWRRRVCVEILHAKGSNICDKLPMINGSGKY